MNAYLIKMIIISCSLTNKKSAVFNEFNVLTIFSKIVYQKFIAYAL